METLSRQIETPKLSFCITLNTCKTPSRLESTDAGLKSYLTVWKADLSELAEFFSKVRPILSSRTSPFNPNLSAMVEENTLFVQNKAKSFCSAVPTEFATSQNLKRITNEQMNKNNKRTNEQMTIEWTRNTREISSPIT